MAGVSTLALLVLATLLASAGGQIAVPTPPPPGGAVAQPAPVALSPPVPPTNSTCTLQPLLFTAPAIMNGGWYRWFQFNFDKTANYVWHTPNAIIDAAIGDAWYTTTISLAAPVMATVGATADDAIQVFINGNLVTAISDWHWVAIQGVLLPAGESLIELHVTNNGGPAGAIFSLKSQADNSVITNTGNALLSQWGWSSARCAAGAELVFGAAADTGAGDCFTMPEADFPMNPVQWVAPSNMTGDYWSWGTFVADADAAWMWYLPNAISDAPYGQAYYYANVTVAQATPAVAYFSADNQVDVYVGGLFVGTNANSGAISTAAVSLPAGNSIIVLRATNWGGPAGVIFSLADAQSGATLLNTGNASQAAAWAWSPCGGDLGAVNKATAGTVAPVMAPPPSVDCTQFADPSEYPYTQPFFTASGSMSGSFFAWSGGVAAVDPTAAFVWSTPAAVVDAPVNTAYYNATVVAAALKPVTIYASADNQVDVFLNGLFVGSNADWSTTATLSATLLAGVNTVELRAANWGGSAGLIMTMLDEHGAVLLNTGSPTFIDSWSVSPCSVLFPPAPPPAAFAPAPPGAAGPNSVACTAETQRASVYLTAPAHATGNGYAWADFSIVDASAAWIWNTPNAASEAPSAQAFFSATLTLAAPTDVLLFFTADNSADVSLNGTVVASLSDWSKVGSVAASLPAGDTPVSVSAINWGGPAGMILSVRDAVTGAVLLNTGAANASAWSWCGAPVTVDTLVVSTELSALMQGGALSGDATAALAAAIALQTGVDVGSVTVGGAAFVATPGAAGSPPAAGSLAPPTLAPPSIVADPAGSGSSAPNAISSAAGRRRRLLDVSLPIVISGIGANESTAQAVAAMLGSPTTLMRLAAAAGVGSVRLASQPAVSARVASLTPPPAMVAAALPPPASPEPVPLVVVDDTHAGVQSPVAGAAAGTPPPVAAAPVAAMPPLVVTTPPPVVAAAPGVTAPPPATAPPAAILPPVVPTVLASSMALAGITVAQFTPAAQMAFVSALAPQLGVAASAITVTGVTAATSGGRHLLQTGVVVAFTVSTPDASAAAAVTAAIVAAPASPAFTASLNTQLVAAGAPATTGVVVMAMPTAVVPPAVVVGASSHAVAMTPALAVLLSVLLAFAQ